MLRKMILFKIILIFFLIYSLSAQSAGQAGYLSVEAQDSIHIFLDGQLISRGSFDSLALQPGTYNIHAFNMNNLSWGNRGITREISVRSDVNEIIRLSETKSIKILSNPPAGKVFYNEDYLGYTPLLFFRNENEDESAEIAILKTGYHEQRFTLISGLDEYDITLNIDKDFRGRFVHRAGLKSEGFRWSREGLVVASLATSWLSFFLKREADNNYDRYLRSSDPGKMKTYYDRTQTLDAYAEISVGISVLSLGTYFYFLLTE